MDTSEKRFERDIESYLISEKGGYQQFVGQDADGNWVHNRQHDVARCIYMDVLCEFIANTQPKEWAKYVKYYGDKAPDKLYTRLEQTITNQGLIYVLRNGITDMGVKLKVCYFKPESALNETLIELYHSNILGCTRQFQYSTGNTNTIDMVLSVNGIPVVAIELKNQFKGQDVWCAMKQFKKDRSSKEFAFRLDHRFLVYFAVDLNEAWMTTQLKDDATYFMPFNMGSNGAGVTGGAGNPNNENGYDTYYVWEEVLQRDSLLDILHRFISHVKEKEEVTKNGVTKTVTKEKLIFPRYHQYDVVRKVIADVREKGAGTNYLIEHSAGSGKSNSIAWIAYRLASLHNDKDESVFDSVIVVTNRVVLDSQLQDTINSFEHVPGLLECIDDKKHSRDLAEALNDKKRIIICTIQKFLFAYKDIEKFSGRKFAIIVDAVQPPKDFDLNIYLNSMFRMYNGDRKQIELVCKNDLMDAIIDKFGKDVKVLANDMKSFRAIVTTATGPVFYSWVFGFGGHVAIRAPEDVKEEYAHLVLEAAEAIKKAQ